MIIYYIIRFYYISYHCIIYHIVAVLERGFVGERAWNRERCPCSGALLGEGGLGNRESGLEN